MIALKYQIRSSPIAYLTKKKRKLLFSNFRSLGDSLAAFYLSVLPSRISLTSNVLWKISKRSLSNCNTARVTHG